MPEVIRGYCPFGCENAGEDRGSDFDDNGYCRHLVGFINLADGQTPKGKLYEPLLPLYRKVDGKEQHTGIMRVLGGKHRKPFGDGDVLVSPYQLQAALTVKDRKGQVTYEPRLGVASRVYREDGQTEVIADPNDERRERARQRVEQAEADLMDAMAQAGELDKARKGGDSPMTTEESAAENRKNVLAEDQKLAMASR